MEIKKFINCKIFGLHNWTHSVAEGLKPTYIQLKSEYGFWDYAKMYCKDCGFIYQESLKLMKNAKYKF